MFHMGSGVEIFSSVPKVITNAQEFLMSFCRTHDAEILLVSILQVSKSTEIELKKVDKEVT